MMTPPVTDIDLARFADDPYPDLARMRQTGPITYVPQLDAVLLTRRDDIHREEKRTDILSSDQPGGLMTVLMGQNMMRRDGEDHMSQRRALFPALSPRTVADHWKPMFIDATQRILNNLKPKGKCDLMADFAMPVSAEALRAITGLLAMTNSQMDESSQGMIDGCSNFVGDPEVEARCNAATALIDAHIADTSANPPPRSALAVMLEAGMDPADIRANIKLVISGGQNEPRDAIAGTAWALLAHPDQLALIRSGQADYAGAFSEYARLHAPIGMSPRRLTQDTTLCGSDVAAQARVFLMFGSAGRDATCFLDPEKYDILRDTSRAIPFGAGPHFCAGAAASRCLISQVALPMLFDALPELELDGPVRLHGWAFRGPISVPVRWKP